jgi:cell division protein FtsA
MMAILYEIQQSGFADRLMSGIVVTGGCAQTANLGNFIYDLSGYRVRTGYPRHLFSFQGCEGITETSAATSIGLIMAAKEDKTLNCAFAKDGYIPETVVNDPEPEEKPRETLFAPEEIETVTPVKKTAEHGKTRRGTKVTWNPFGKIKDFCGGLYDTVHQEFEEIENEEA